MPLPFIAPAGMAPDYLSISARAGDFTDTTGRTVSTIEIAPGESTAIILVYGDSFGANSAPTPYAPAEAKLDQVNIINNVCYRQTDPVLGVTNTGGNMLSRLGKKLIDGLVFERVIFINVSAGGTQSSDWIHGGEANHRLRTALWISRLIAQPVTAIIQILGTNDADNGVSQATFESNFANIRGFIRGHNCDAPIYVTKVSYVDSVNDTDIRAAQDAVVNEGLLVRAGPDIDPPVIPAGERTGDDLHPDDTGQDHFADLYFDILEADFA